MKKVTILSVILFAVLSFHTLHAQTGMRMQNAKQKFKGAETGETSGQRAQAYADTLKNVLSLTDEQYKKVLAINTDFISKRDVLKKSLVSDSTGQAKTQIKTLKQDRNMQIKAVLSPDQQAKWVAWKKDKVKINKSPKVATPLDDNDGM